MGYYVQLIDSSFAIPREKWDEAFEELVELNTHDELKTGGRYSAGETVERWFAWMDADYPARAREEHAAGKFEHPLIYVFDALSFDWEIDDDGLGLIGYDSKMGGEEHFLHAVAPFVRSGSYLDWRGEDDTYWRMAFDGKTMTQEPGRVVFGE